MTDFNQLLDMNSESLNQGEEGDLDICRVCRMEATPDRPLHFPCLCMGSIKYIHQECLLQWLHHSKKEYCELCNHKFVFKPVYAPDMPTSMPPQELLQGLGKSIFRALRFWLHYTLVVLAWLGVVPLTAYRIYKCLFSGSLHSLLTLPMDMLSVENAFTDCLFGIVVVGASVGGFILLLWLREQILVHDGPEWLIDAEEGNAFQLDAFIMNFIQNQLWGQAGVPQVPEQNDDLIDERQEPVENQPEPNNDIEEEVEPVDDTINQVIDSRENLDQEQPLENVEVEVEPNVQEDDILNQEPLPEGDQPVEGEVLANEQENLVPDPQVPDEGGWNPDALMEDLTWEKFLGLDGSFIFLEHVFWIISLNTSFVLVFIFCPYHFGEMILNFFGYDDKILTGTAVDGLLVLKIGYVSIAGLLILLHSLLRYTSFSRFRRTVGLCYTVLKVSLLMTVEIGIFPLIIGWWLDICSLPLFSITAKDRKESFLYAPATATFLHWLVGMLYVFYFAAFIILLREVLRPGVLWFLRNINDPQFHPVREMIQLSVFRHARRVVLSMVVFGTTVLILVWLPVQLVKHLTNGFIPFNVSLSRQKELLEEVGEKGENDAPISEMSLELLLLQVILPAFLEQGHARRWLKTFIQYWAKAVAYLFDLRSYLVGDVDIKGLAPASIVHVDNNGKWQRGPPPRGTPLENQIENVGSPTVRAYSRTNFFKIKVALFLTVVIGTFVMTSFSLLTVPVFIGRKLLSLVFGNTIIHELYTSAAGFYVLWLLMRLLSAASAWYPVGWEAVYNKVKTFTLIVLKVLVASVAVLLIIPLLLGILFEFVVVIPLRVPLDQTALLYIWQDWALGVLHLKILCALIMVGPDWWLRDAIDRAYRNGFANLDLMFILQKIIYPVSISLLLAITTPYACVAGIMPLLGFEKSSVVLCLHRVYPLLMLSFLVVGVLLFQGKQFKSLYEKIKNEKYLIGKVLVNYERKKPKAIVPVEN